jgi:hypothetical protein
MTLSDTLDRLGSFLARTLGRTTTIMIGFAATIVGLGMTSTIVLLPLGVVTAFLAIAVFLKRHIRSGHNDRSLTAAPATGMKHRTPVA